MLMPVSSTIGRAEEGGVAVVDMGVFR
jgi:hypothetical protein